MRMHEKPTIVILGAVLLVACAHVPVDKTYRAVRADELPERVAGDLPPPDFRAEVVEEEQVVFPRNLVLKYANRQLEVVVKLCADGVSGHVNHVRIVDGVPEAESAVVEALRRWRVRPQRDGVPICT